MNPSRPSLPHPVAFLASLAFPALQAVQVEEEQHPNAASTRRSVRSHISGGVSSDDPLPANDDLLPGHHQRTFRGRAGENVFGVGVVILAFSLSLARVINIS